MKKFIVILSLLVLGNLSFATEFDNVQKDTNPMVLTGNLVFDWLDISQIDRDEVIKKYQKELFGEGTVYKYKKKEFRQTYKDYLKDNDHKRHYMLVSNNVRETDKENLCGFYKGNLLISYAVQYKDNLKTTYYYDALGNLRYIDVFSENYPSFPYFSKQYRSNGTLVSAIYFMSHDMQYMYNENGNFKGAWYKDKMYDRKAKEVLTRTNW